MSEMLFSHHKLQIQHTEFPYVSTACYQYLAKQWTQHHSRQESHATGATLGPRNHTMALLVMSYSSGSTMRGKLGR